MRPAADTFSIVKWFSNVLRRLLVLLAVWLALTLPAPATTVIPPRFEDLVDTADLIFTGQAVAQKTEWRTLEGKSSLVTLVTFSVQRIHKGLTPSVVTLQFLGGSLGDVKLDVSEVPKFRMGERVVLFVEGNGVTVSPLVGFFHGKFSLKREPDGRESLLQHDGHPLLELRQIGSPKSAGGDASTRPVLLDEFTGHIARRLNAVRK